MGAKCNFIVLSVGEPKQWFDHLPSLDSEATDHIARRFAGDVVFDGATDLGRGTAPFDDMIAAGVFGPLAIVDAKALAKESTALPPAVVTTEPYTSVDHFVLQSTVGLGCYGRWSDGRLLRAFAAADSDVYEDIGERMPFETGTDYEEDHGFEWMVNEAMALRLGFLFEGRWIDGAIRPSDVPLRRYRFRR